jgi:hypothetical protein
MYRAQSTHITLINDSLTAIPLVPYRVISVPSPLSLVLPAISRPPLRRLTMNICQFVLVRSGSDLSNGEEVIPQPKKPTSDNNINLVPFHHLEAADGISSFDKVPIEAEPNGFR